MSYYYKDNSNSNQQYYGATPRTAPVAPVAPTPAPPIYQNISGDGLYDLDGILLNPKDCVVAFIDHEPQMYLAVRSHEPEYIRSNTVGLAEACKLFHVPTVLTSIDEATFSGITLHPIREALGNPPSIDRSCINAWQDKNFVAAIKATGRKKLIISALWTELCGLMPALSAKAEGFDVYFVADASGGATKEAHERAMQRMIQAGIHPVTWEQVMLEWQRCWSRKETAGGVLKIANEHGGAYGIGIEYHDQIAKGLVKPDVEMAP